MLALPFSPAVETWSGHIHPFMMILALKLRSFLLLIATLKVKVLKHTKETDNCLIDLELGTRINLQQETYGLMDLEL